MDSAAGSASDTDATDKGLLPDVKKDQVSTSRTYSRNVAHVRFTVMSSPTTASLSDQKTGTD